MNILMPFVEDSYPVDHEILEFYSDNYDSPNSYYTQSIVSSTSSVTKQIKKRHQ